MPDFVICEGCRAPLTNGKPCATLTRGTFEEGEFQPDPSAETVYLCYSCAENVDNIHGQMRLSGRY